MKTIPDELKQEIRRAFTEVEDRAYVAIVRLDDERRTKLTLDDVRIMRGILADVSKKLEALEEGK